MPLLTKPWKAEIVPDAVQRVPSMLTSEESQYLQWSTRATFEGWGAVVDLGPWLGSSAAALAQGLQSGGKSAKVRCFDLFEWDPTYMGRADLPRLHRGQDFLPLFRQLTSAWADRLEPTKADLLTAEWHGGPIEILFVDAAKSWTLLNAILKVFGPHLEPGRSRVILQDFRHFYTYWLPLVFHGHPELWQEVEAVDVGTTVTFTPRKPLGDEEQIRRGFTEDDFPFGEAERILMGRIALEVGRNRQLLRLTLYFLALLRGQMGRGQLRKDEGDHLDLRAIASTLEARTDVQAGWTAFDAGDLEAAREQAEADVLARGRSTATLLLMGFIAQARGHQEEAKVAFNDALDLAFDAYTVVPGWRALEAGDLETAQRQVQGYLDTSGESAEPLFLLGRIAQERRELDHAEALFTRALEIDPYYEHSRRSRGALGLARGYDDFTSGDLDGARRRANEFVRAFGESADALFLLGLIAQARGSVEEATRLFSRVIEIDPRHGSGRLHLAAMLVDAGSFDLATREVLTALETIPLHQTDDVRHSFALIQALVRDSERAKAVAAALTGLEAKFSGTPGFQALCDALCPSAEGSCKHEDN